MKDVNHDGEISISDVQAIINAIVKNDFSATDLFDPELADYNHDGEITISDVQAIIDYIVHKK